MKKCHSLGGILFVLTLVACTSRERVTLAVDFTTHQKWHSIMDVSVWGTIASDRDTQEFENDATCELIGTPDSSDPAALYVVVDTVSIRSSFLTPLEIENLCYQFHGKVIRLSLSEGMASVSDSVVFPAVNLGGWDIFRHFSRVLPALPQSPVKKGESWERNRRFPLETSHGDAVAHVYQLFTLDSLYEARDGERYGIVRWDFSYDITPETIDTATLFDNVPMHGEGEGYAEFNISQRYFRKAGIRFDVTKAAKNPLSIIWHEKVELVVEHE
jgi:hypothetical protein